MSSVRTVQLATLLISERFDEQRDDQDDLKPSSTPGTRLEAPTDALVFP